MKNYRIILFDLDGTLTDSGDGIINSVIYALGKCGIEETDRRKLFGFVGPPLADSFMRFYGMTGAEAAHAVACYREYYPKKGIYENRVYDGVKELLFSLQEADKTLMVASAKPEVFVREVLRYYDMTHFFANICGATLSEERNKKQEVIEYALRGIKDRTACVMVGDRDQDVFGAQQCGIDSIGVLYGYGDAKELAGATYFAQTPEAVGRILLREEI